MGDGDFDLPTRVSKIREVIDAFPVQDVQTVLDYCEKLICDGDINTANLGYTIIQRLAQQKECTSMHRATFFTKIVYDDRPKHYLQHRSYLFSFLTDQGRNIEGYQGILPKLIPSFYKEATEFRTMHDLYAQQATQLGVTLPDSLDVLCNIIKFNATFVRDKDISHLIEQMFAQRDRTATLKYHKSIAIVESLITYSSIPKDAVPSLARLFCFWHGQWYIATKNTEVENVQAGNDAQCWKALTWLLSTHLRDLVFDGLVNSLRDSSPYYQQARGAASLIHESLTNPQTRKLVNLNLSKLMDTLVQPNWGDDIGISGVRLKLILDLLGDSEMQQIFSAELDWTQFQRAIVHNVTTPPYTFGETDEAADNPMLCPDGDRVFWRISIVRSIIERLETLPGMTLTQSRTLRKIALSSAPLLDKRQTEKLIEAYHPSAFRISVGNWLPEIKEIAQVFISSNEPNLLHRQQALHVVNGALQKAQELGEPEAVLICGTIILEALEKETNYRFRGNLTHCVITFVSQHFVESDDGFQKIVDILRRSARVECHHNLTGENLVMHDMLDRGEEVETIEDRFTGEEDLPSMLPDAGLVVMLMRNSMFHPQRARMLYREILDLVVYNETDRDPEATVMLLRGLFRIRADIEHRIFFVASPEGESLAASLNRNANNPKQSLRRGSNWGEEEKPPAWRYGDIQGLPEDPPTTISPVLRSDPSNPTATDDNHLDMADWLRIVADIIQVGADWEIYSYTIVHIGAQLSNQSLFTECVPQIRELARCICSKIQQQAVMKPPEASNLRQGDVAFCLINILTTIIGYHWHFPRNETENMITAFIIGLTAWDTTTVPCVHALTLCCYELPISLTRDLVRIVEKMSTIVTKSDAAIHVLEFLAGLSRLELTSRFHGDEIKIVFGVCFSYIEYARGKRFDETQQRANNRSVNPTRQGSIASGQRPSTEDIPQYVFAISYHIITFWFLTLKPEDRKKYLPWMEQRLLSRDQAGNVEDEALVTLDHLWRVAEGRIMSGSSPIAPTETSSSWISEYCMLTVLCDEGAVEIVERRASGTDHRQLTCPSPTATPEEVFDHYDLSQAMDGPFTSASPPTPLIMTDNAKRGLTFFDKTSPVDFLKCGIIYVGESQTQEAVILANCSGSPDYNLLVAGLGYKVSLAEHRGNTAGLDTSEYAIDGKTTHQYSDGVTTLNYHITTLMPFDKHDPLSTRKKSHIGNDYVNIVFNNSGLVSGFDFHTFPSQFNYVYIVVTPEARQTFVQTRTRSKEAKWFEDSWFRVQVMTREDFPGISSAAETKVVSGNALAAYVRNLALNAEVFCRVWTNRGSGEYPSSWRSRLGQIRQLKDRNDKLRLEREKAEKGE